MNRYVVELHLPTGGAPALAAAGERARSAAEQLSREGTLVRCVRSVYVAEDGTCLLVFDATSWDAVHRAARRANLVYERVVEEGHTT
jgi:Nickel responsive protein SCO4226-like